MKTRSEIEDQNWEVINETNKDFNERVNNRFMKRIKEFGASEIMCGIQDGQVVMLTNTSHDHFENEEMFTLYDHNEIYAIYKLLEEADRKGGFDAFKKKEIFFEFK